MQEATNDEHVLNRWHEQINLVLSQLNEKQRRLVAGLLSNTVGRGGVTLLSQVTGLDRKTVRTLGSGTLDFVDFGVTHNRLRVNPGFQ